MWNKSFSCFFHKIQLAVILKEDPFQMGILSSLFQTSSFAVGELKAEAVNMVVGDIGR
jgi:hypothetical protein